MASATDVGKQPPSSTVQATNKTDIFRLYNYVLYISPNADSLHLIFVAASFSACPAILIDHD